jgi:hypothetical protein
MSEFVWQGDRFLGLDSVEWLVWLVAIVGLAAAIGSTVI